jgi:hypothetical protein
MFGTYRKRYAFYEVAGAPFKGVTLYSREPTLLFDRIDVETSQRFDRANFAAQL